MMKLMTSMPDTLRYRLYVCQYVCNDGFVASAENVNTPDTLPRVSKPAMVMRSIRVPAKLWEAAKAKADEREENISDVVRDALRAYVEYDS